jgi:hypothetical protein
MQLKDVVPWGRSLAEYQAMFDLSETDLGSRILGCADGPASFNAELTARGGNVVSVDPVYQFEVDALRHRIADVYQEIMPQVVANREKYVWKFIKDPEQLGELRMSAMENFLADYCPGKQQGRYVTASLPDLPFADQSFDLALCSHFLFLYSDQLGMQQHLDGLKELCRVAGQVRIYPLLTLSGEPSPLLDRVTSLLLDSGFKVRLDPVSYEFQLGATEMLVIDSEQAATT